MLEHFPTLHLGGNQIRISYSDYARGPSLALHRSQIELLLVEGILCLRLGPWLSHLPAERRLSLIDESLGNSVISGDLLSANRAKVIGGGCFL